MSQYNQVVRVAVTNNFNCTEEEFSQLHAFEVFYPNSFFFVNCNINTPLLSSLNDESCKAVITVNPNIRFNESVLEKLYEIDPEKISFVRVKYIPKNQEVLDLIDELLGNGHTVVITMQRFNSKVSISKFLTEYQDHYRWSHNRFRLLPEAQQVLREIADSNSRAFLCDRAGLGCKGCGLCSSLTVGEDLPITSLNMSSSGICKFSCPDCYAKTMQHFLRVSGQPPIHFDQVKMNKKQAGTMKHIKEARNAAQA